jgi:hypothetical protein
LDILDRELFKKQWAAIDKQKASLKSRAKKAENPQDSDMHSNDMTPKLYANQPPPRESPVSSARAGASAVKVSTDKLQKKTLGSFAQSESPTSIANESDPTGKVSIEKKQNKSPLNNYAPSDPLISRTEV